MLKGFPVGLAMDGKGFCHGIKDDEATFVSTAKEAVSEHYFFHGF